MNGQDFVNFAINTLNADSQKRFADVDMSESSAFYNLVLLPFSILSKPVFDLHDSMVNSMSLDALSGSQLDDFGSMFFVSRPTKSYVTLQIQIYLPITSDSVEPLTVQTSDEFRTKQNVIFYPVQDYIFAYNALPNISLVDNAGNSTTYKVATILTSSTIATSQVLANSITSTSLIYQLVPKVNNIFPSSLPLAAQTDSEYKTTIREALSLRNNVNPASIISNFSKAFPFASFQPIGYGDPEMQRDIAVAGQYWSGHFGGMTDIYATAQLVPATYISVTTTGIDVDGHYVSFTMQAYKGFDWAGIDISEPSPNQLLPWTQIETSGIIPSLPVVLIDSIQLSDNGNNVDVLLDASGNQKIKIIPQDKNYRFSQYEILEVRVYYNFVSNPK